MNRFVMPLLSSVLAALLALGANVHASERIAVDFQLVDCFERLKNEDRSDLESALGVQVPDEYWNFLCKHNGGTLPQEAMARVRLPDSKTDDWHLTFYHYEARHHEIRGKKRAYTSIVDRFQSFLRPISSDWLTIGSTGADYELLMGVSKGNRGKIAEYTPSHRSDDGEAKVVVVANSLSRFLKSVEVFQIRRFDDPLLHAADIGDLDHLKALLTQGGDVNSRNEAGETLLQVALGRPEILSVVLEFDPELLATDKAGKTALHHAAGAEPVEALKLFLDRLKQDGLLKKNLAIKDKRGLTPVKCDLKNDWQARIVFEQFGVSY